MTEELSHREKIILRYIIEDFIKNVNPVGSKQISKSTDINLSSASIRNIMSGLEDKKLLTHTHTSAGRIPTDKGYRYFVDTLMEKKSLDDNEMKKISSVSEELDLMGDDIFREVSKILGKLTKELSVVSQPYFSEGFFEKIEIITLSSTKILVVVSIVSGLVRTIIFDIDSSFKREQLDKVARVLNEKLYGLTLKEIRRTYYDRIKDLSVDDLSIINIFVDSIDKIFQDEKEGMTLYIGGTVEVLSQPEFDNTNEYKNMLEFVQDKDVVFHVLNKLYHTESGLSISIGIENDDEKLKNYSVISTAYSSGDVKGKIALIGPKRMDYSKMCSMLEYTSKIICEKI